MKKTINILLLCLFLYILLSILINGNIYKKYAISPCNLDQSIEKKIFIQEYKTNNPDFRIWKSKLCFIYYWGIIPIYKTYSMSEDSYYINVKYIGKDTNSNFIFKSNGDEYGLDVSKSSSFCNSSLFPGSFKVKFISIYKVYGAQKQEMVDSVNFK